MANLSALNEIERWEAGSAKDMPAGMMLLARNLDAHAAQIAYLVEVTPEIRQKLGEAVRATRTWLASGDGLLSRRDEGLRKVMLDSLSELRPLVAAAKPSTEASILAIP